MLSTARAALDEIRRTEGVDYADCRVIDQEREAIHLRLTDVERLDRRSSRGVGVRVLYKGAWGFAARPGTSEADATRAARTALEVARAGAAFQKEKIRLTEEEPAVGSWATPLADDPFAVSLERKLADLQGAVDILRAEAGG